MNVLTEKSVELKDSHTAHKPKQLTPLYRIDALQAYLTREHAENVKTV